MADTHPMKGVAPSIILTPEEVMSDKIPEPVIEGLLYKGHLHTLAGATKDGKSYLAYQGAACVSTGTPFLGLPVKQCPVLIFSLEMSAAVVQGRIQTICKDCGIPEPVCGRDWFLVAPLAERPFGLSIRDPEGCSAFVAAIQQCGAGLVILDTVGSATVGTTANADDLLGPVYEFLVDAARMTGAALWVLDHTRKGEQPAEIAHAASGTQVKGARSAVISRLKRVQRNEPGGWELASIGHFPTADAITYTRPQREDGSYGVGCIRCESAVARGVDSRQLEALFRESGERGEDGRLRIVSKRQFIEAVQKAGLAGTGNSTATADAVVNAIEKEHCIRADAPDAPWKNERRVWIEDGPRGAKVYVLRVEVERSGAVE